MKIKRLNRERTWGFQYYPYYQMRVDTDSFHGLACLIRLTDGEKLYWEQPNAGKIQVAGGGMTWLELLPDDQNLLINCMYLPDDSRVPERNNYPAYAMGRYPPSVWYVDFTDGYAFDEDGIAVYRDAYLDLIITPEGDIQTDDLDELDEAYAVGDLTQEQYENTLSACTAFLSEYSQKLWKLHALCTGVRDHVEHRVACGEPILVSREVRELQDKLKNE
ncbi:MAG: DUF402 domain-containing protein [Clostridia bacterium]|nr:DUF402 domain-containing protein [Clostridia bacterium]